MSNVSRFKSRLAIRLVFFILLFSSVITLLSTGAQLFFEYKRDLGQINSTVDQIRQAHLSTIIKSLWVYDLTMLETELQGIKELPDIGYVGIYKDNKVIISAGQPLRDHYRRHSFSLPYTHKGQELALGTLQVDVSLLGLYQRLRERVIIILVTQAFKTFLVSSFTFFLFYFLVGRHLNTMAEFARSFSFKNLKKPLQLARHKAGSQERDELSLVEAAINEMRVNLIQEIDFVRSSQKALAKSEQRFRSLVDNIPGVVYRRDLKFPWKVFYISEMVEGFTGYPVEDFLSGQLLFGNLLHPTDAAEVETRIQEMLEKGQPYEIDYRLTHKDGTVRWLFEKGRAVYDEAGNPLWVDGVILDITEKKETERQLDKKELLLQSIIENTSDAVFFKDAAGRYVLANTATLKAIGKAEHEVIGKNDFELFPAASAKTISKIDSAAMAADGPLLAEEKLRTSSGDTYWQANKSALRDPAGNLLGLVGISRNITEIKRNQLEREELKKRLIQAQKMEAVGTLAGGIAHDFNNILAVIIGYAELARDDVPPASKAVSDLDKVLEAGNRARNLVKQILAFSRQAEAKPIPLQLQSLIKETLKMLRASIPTTITMREDLDSSCGVVLADPTQVNQILMNLCTNASQAMEEHGGLLTVSLKKIYKNKDDRQLPVKLKEGPYVELAVSDTGTGIGPDVIDKIFNPYFTTKEVGKGTGMGLAIIHGIIREHGGEIAVESELGRGTTFRVYFPSVSRAQLPVLEKPAAIPQGSERILFIDDEELLAEMGKNMLERLGYQVTVRQSSIDALSTFQNDPNSFDLVITDQTMPGMTGSDLARRILQIRPGMPIILCTGYSNLIDAESAKAMGIREFAMKPLSKGAIGKLIRKILDTA